MPAIAARRRAVPVRAPPSDAVEQTGEGIAAERPRGEPRRGAGTGVADRRRASRNALARETRDRKKPRAVITEPSLARTIRGSHPLGLAGRRGARTQ